MTLDYQIREMQREDLEQVAALENSCFSMPWKYRDFEEVLTNTNRFYLVAVMRDNCIIGGCMLTNISGEGDITNVAVSEKYRNCHVATALLESLLKFGIDKCGISAFTLEVRSKNMAARRLYENLGFISEGIRPNYYEKPKDDAVIMWKRYIDI